MTAYPGLPLDIQAEMYVNAQWHTITSDIYQRSPVAITRGVTDESTSSVAGRCGLVLNNRTGNYDPEAPMGAYYGSFGRGTPFRLAVRTGQDQFARTVSNGWGTADTGGAWATEGAGGTLNASDYNVASGVGTHSVPAVTAHRTTYLSTSSYTDVDVAVTCSVLPIINVTGGQVELANIVLRGNTTGPVEYLARAAIQTDQTVQLSVYYVNGASTTTIVAPTTITGVNHVGSNQLRVRALIEAQVIRVKIWDITNGTEPADWQVTAQAYGAGAPLLNGAGYVGVRSGIATGNTNTLPVVFSYDDFQVRIPRYAGSVASIVPTADITGNDAYATVQVAGVLRQLAGSGTLLQSTLRRSIPTLGAQLVAYWPMEDGVQAGSMASGIGGIPMAIYGFPTLASYTGFPSSAPLPVMAQSGTLSAFTGQVPIYSATGSWQVRCLVCLSNPADGSTLMRVTTTGSVTSWDVSYSASVGANLNIKAYAPNGTKLLDVTPGFALASNLAFRLSLQASVSGSDIAYTLSILPLGVGQSAGYYNSTLTAQTASSVAAVAINPFSQCAGFAFGHVTVESAVSDIFTLLKQFNAYVGEDAGTRFVRLCKENGITGDLCADTDVAPAMMGAQLVNTLSALLQECADADRGIIYEPRGAVNALTYKSLGAHYNQPVTLALNTATHDLAEQPEVTYDDQSVHNTITVMRPSGSSVTAQQTTGPLSSASPVAGGIGQWQQQVTANVQTDGQLSDLAAWLVHVGTVPDPRFPPMPINMLRPGNAGLTIAAATVDVDDLVTLAGWYPDVQSLLARGYTESLTGYQWTLTFNLAPASPFTIFALDDTVLGRLDSATTTLSAAITSSVTSFTVAVGDGTLWTTNSGDWPVLIRVGGEVMSVGAISGTTSPQTFSSVTRSVNGVAKAHNLGDQVTVSQAVYLALGRP
jgi:hypothetical protein